MNYLARFIQGYIECAFWASNDNADDSGGEPLDRNYTPEIDLSPESKAGMVRDCTDFVQANSEDLDDVDPEQAGHDFWLTRNRHGVGFWDRGLGALGERLTQASRAYGEVDLYVGDDGLIYGGFEP